MRGMRVVLRTGAVAAVAFALAAGLWWHGEAQAARELRERYSFGSDIGYGLISEDVARWREALLPTEEPTEERPQVASASGGLISDHDLFMLVEATKFQVGRDVGLAAAVAEGRLPVRYAYLDGFDTNAIVLRRSLRDALAGMAVPDLAGAGGAALAASGPLGSWQLAPVLVGLASSPSVRRAAARSVADEPLLAVHTCGQVLSGDVRCWGVRYALGCVQEEPALREREVAALQTRAEELAAQADAVAGDDDAAYVRTAFDLIAGGVAYAPRGSSPHDNDAYGALVEGAARCWGLAGALKLALDARGIPNYLANGDKRGERHTVNVLWMEGSWRVCDLTLMAGAREGTGRAGGGAHQGIYACLVLERSYCVEHGFVPDDDARVLELVYSRTVNELGAGVGNEGA